MHAALNAIVIVLLWATVLVRLPAARREPRQRALWSIFLTLAVAKVLGLEGVAGFLGAALGRADTSIFLQHLLGIIGSALLFRFLALTADGKSTWVRARRTHWTLAGVVSLIEVVLFALAPEGVDCIVIVDAPRLSVTAVAYWVVLEVFLGISLGMATVVFSELSRKTSVRLLKCSFRIIATGALLNFCYAVFKVVVVIGFWMGVVRPGPTLMVASTMLLEFAVALMILGAATPLLRTAWKIFAAHLVIHRLRPLWRIVQREFPGVVLHAATSGRILSLEDPRFRIYRMIIEIRDGLLELGRYVPSDALAEARAYLHREQVPGDGALVEACWIRLALRRYGAGVDPVDGGAQPIGGGASIEEEAEWLCQVGRLLARSEHPTRFADWWESRAKVAG